MSWFKFSKDFKDRNTVNSKIRYLTEVKGTLEVLSKLIFQSGKNAKDANYKIISSSKITSYPLLHEILIEADALALDSPWKFKVLCEEGMIKADKLIYGLKKEREELTYDRIKDTPKKGLV
jgi:hypothetical protein